MTLKRWPSPDTEDYFNLIEGQGIILDVENRREEILEQVTALAAEVGGEIKPDPALLAEVTHLVEAPTALWVNLKKNIWLCPPRCW